MGVRKREPGRGAGRGAGTEMGTPENDIGCRTINLKRSRPHLGGRINLFERLQCTQTARETKENSIEIDAHAHLRG